MPSAGDFETWELLGRNAYGAVYRGVQFSLKRDVAIFELDSALRKEAEHAPRFWDETAQVAALTDDALVPVFAIDRKLGWIVMELMAGHCGQLLDKPQPVDVARSVLRQGLSGLRRLHDAGRTHGDLRPATLLIHRSGRVKLSFALGAAMAGGLPYQRREMKYVAPELVSPALGEFGPRADLYCLAFSVLELLLGPKFKSRFPGVGGENDADDKTAWMRWHADEGAKLPSVEEMVPAAAGPLATLLDRMLKKRANERFASAEEALKLLAESPLVPVMAPGVTPGDDSGGAALVGNVDKLLDPASRYDIASPANAGGAAGLAAGGAGGQRKQVAAPGKGPAIAKGAVSGKGAAAGGEKKKSQLPAILVGLGFAGIVGFIVLSDNKKKPEEPAPVAAVPAAITPTPTPTPSPTPTAPVPVPTPTPTPTAVDKLVEPRNTPPTIETIADAVVTLPLDPVIDVPAVSFRVKANDPDDLGALPKFVLVESALPGAELDARTGRFTFTPKDAASLKPGSYPVTVEVFDQGATPASTKAKFQIVVKSDAVKPEAGKSEAVKSNAPTIRLNGTNN